MRRIKKQICCRVYLCKFVRITYFLNSHNSGRQIFKLFSAYTNKYNNKSIIQHISKLQKVIEPFSCVPYICHTENDEFIFQSISFTEIALRWFEYACVNGIVEDFNRIFSQKALFRQVCEPTGRCNNCHVFYTCKSVFFLRKIHAAIVSCITCRIMASLAAVYTMCLPLIAIHSHKMCTVACKGPTIMQCPTNLHIRATFYPIKQQLIIYVIPMQIMQPQKIRIILFCPPQKASGGLTGSQAVFIKNACTNQMQISIPIVTNSHSIFFGQFRHIVGASVCNLYLMTVRFQLLRNIDTNSAGAPNTTYRVND